MTDQEKEIYEFLSSQPLKKLTFIHGSRGLPAKKTIRNRNAWNIPSYEKRDLEKYYLQDTDCGVLPEFEKTPKIEKFKNPKVIAHRILSFTTIPQSRLIIKAYWDQKGEIISKSSLVNIFIPEIHRKQMPLPVLCLLLNSRFVSWFTQRFIYSKYFETSKDFDVKYIRSIPYFQLTKEQREVLEFFSRFLHDLDPHKINNNDISDTESGFILELVDLLVIEGYFKAYISNKISKENSMDLFSIISPNITSFYKEDQPKIREIIDLLTKSKQIKNRITQLNKLTWIKEIQNI